MSEYCAIAQGDPWHGPYHDREHGFPLHRDEELFERFVLEINQAGLSWLTILKRKDNFAPAFDGFDIDRVAAYGPEDQARLLADTGIIRNRLKVAATIDNAKRIVALRPEYGSFKGWLDAHHPLDKADWVKLFRKTFRFAGPEIVGEFLMGTGYLPGAHREDCPVYAEIAKLKPAFLTRV